MAKAQFSFNSYPYRFISQFTDTQWTSQIDELPNKGAEQEALLPKEELQELLIARNAINTLPLINFTTQYALACFEGLKAYPHVDGSIHLFRPDKNATRFYNSMEGLMMPPFPKEAFVSAIIKLLQKSIALGYKPQYKSEYEKDNFISAPSIYIRPFTYTEAGFGINLSEAPYVVIVAAEVGSYFDIVDCPSLLVSNRARATPNGTGSIKCAANYVLSSLDKNEAIQKGYIESLFLDAIHHRYVEECSSCNVFFILEDDTIVTPPLSDTILPGITRESVITLLQDAGHAVVERAISIEEVIDSAKECFSTGTAVGVSHFGKIDYKHQTKLFRDGTIGPITQYLQTKLKRIQYGLDEDTHNWLIRV